MIVEAGVSNYAHPRSTDAEQVRMVRSVRVDPGYIWRAQPPLDDTARDIAVLTLSSPLDLAGPDVHAVALPAISAASPLGTGFVVAGFGLEKKDTTGSGALEQMRPSVIRCEIMAILCASSATSAICNGDSGAGLVTWGSSPTLVGVASFSLDNCVRRGVSFYTYVGAAAIRRFIYGDSPPGAPPKAAATRWVPSGWTSRLISVPGQLLAFSLPNAWSQIVTKSGAGIFWWNQETTAEAAVFVSPDMVSERHFFVVAVAGARKTYLKGDTNADLHSRMVRLSVGPALELISQVTTHVGSHSSLLRVASYNVFHAGVGYNIEYVGPVSDDGIDIPVFQKSAQTIHFGL